MRNSSKASEPLSVVFKKVAVVLTLLVIGLLYLGWLPKDRARDFVRLGISLFLIGFIWRVGAWLLAP